MLSNAGMALARMYATTETPKLDPSQVAQWTRELEERWLDPRSARTKMYLVDTFTCPVNNHIRKKINIQLT